MENLRLILLGSSLVFAYDLLEDRRTHVIIKFLFCCSNSLSYRTDRSAHVAVLLFSNRSQMTSKYGKNKTVALIERLSYDLEKQIPCVFVSCFICQSFLS